MRTVEFVDDNGYRQKAMVPDYETNPRVGIPLQPPDVERLDWELIKRNLHGLLLDRNLLTLADVQQRQGDFMECIITALKRPLLVLYQQGD